MSQAHELFTHMLFIDAIIGVGERPLYVSAPRGTGSGVHPNPLVGTTFDRDGPLYAWNLTALEALPLETLQDLYTGLKLHEVTHAH